MAKYAVSAHQTEWHVAKDKGRIKLKLDGIKDIKTVTPTSATEFFAMLIMLQGHKRVLYDSDKGILATSW